MPKDPHSFARPDEAVLKHLELNLNVDFQKKQLSGIATFQIENKQGVNKLYLDTENLAIERVTIEDRETKFKLGEPVEFLGSELIIDILPDTQIVRIHYSTNEDAAALQWLEPAQTAGGEMPFLYTQSQAILARTWVPCQDTPSVRITYSATIKVPSDLMAVMSAENPTRRNSSGVYQFQMLQPIPSYLLALAVGDIDFRPTGERSGVYAEPSLVEKAAWEFADTPKMMAAVERLYGPYRWGRYDLIILPPSFPWGGMENPRLTFATPTLLAGDRSLVGTIAHELAHSWSGNLVTNATWNDFWLNEGFTSYLTHRILEELYGKDHVEMLAVLSLQDLKKDIGRLPLRETHLKADLAGIDPEEGVTTVPYEKGDFFLCTIEQAVGRDKWDAFLRSYFDDFAFQSIPTEVFLDYLHANLISGDQALEQKLQIDAWIYGPGIPGNIVRVHSDILDKVDAQLKSWIAGRPAKELETSSWTTHEWMDFIRGLPESLDASRMAELDQAFHFSTTYNAEIRYEWLLQVIALKYEPAYSSIDEFLNSQGRRKYVKGLFKEMAKNPDQSQLAQRIFQKAKPLYHSISREAAERILYPKMST